jgi:ParB-like chromosome segregation protein Spo0J
MVTTAKNAAGRDDRIEEWLKGHGAEFEYDPDLPLDQIDREVSNRNQARISGRPLIDEFVQLFATAMANRAKFPPLVMFREKDHFVVIDGNHRVAAADENKRKKFPAYIITNPSPARIKTLTYEANTKHGIPTQADERLIQAMYLVDTGMSQTNAAKIVGIPRERLVRKIAQKKTRERVEELGVPRVERINDTSMDRLSSLRSDPVLKNAAALVADANLNADATGEFVKRLNETTRSDAQAMELIETERKNRRAEIDATLSGIVTLPGAVKRLASSVGLVLSIRPEAFDEIPESVGKDYRELLAERASLASKQLATISRKLKK